jgi:cupin superfamily acireductone dioxygenase involved in methionine salvage
MVCAMREIEQSVYLEGISLEALAAVQRSDISYGHLYEQNFHSSDVSNLLLARFMEQTTKSQRNIAELNKHATYIKKRFCECIDDFVANGHNSLDTLATKFQQQNNDPDPALRFLCAVEKTFDFNNMSEEITSLDNKSAELIQISKSVCSSLAQDNWNLNHQSPSWFNVVTCPKDGTKLRLPENSGDLVVTCPTCKYRFSYNTSEMTFNGAESLLRKLKKLF